MSVIKFINAYRLSNTFIIDSGFDGIVLIDVGGPDFDKIKYWLTDHEKRVEAVILTHEHADHCIGVNALYELNAFEIYCSRQCANNIKNSKQNYSFYSEEIPTFEILLPVKIVSDSESFRINNLLFTGIETPGHSPGGMCYSLDNMIFTGDTLLNNTKTPLSFPHSNRVEYENSKGKLMKIIKPGTIVYPGHGEAFQIF